MFGNQRKAADADLSASLQAADEARRLANARLQQANEKIGLLEWVFRSNVTGDSGRT